MTQSSPRFISIASGKGGVGKTWFAITLAHALAQRSRRVLLFDGDLGLANVDIQLGLMPDLDLGSVLAGKATLAQAVTRFEPGGFDVLAGRSGSGALSTTDLPALDAILSGLQTFGASHDVILLDLGAGVGRAVRRMAAFADTLLVIATEEPTSLTDAYATLKLHAADRPDGDARLIINQATSRAGAERTAATLKRACKSLLGCIPDMAGTIRRDMLVPDAIRKQALLLDRHPTSPAAEDLRQIAAKL